MIELARSMCARASAMRKAWKGQQFSSFPSFQPVIIDEDDDEWLNEREKSLWVCPAGEATMSEKLNSLRDLLKNHGQDSETITWIMEVNKYIMRSLPFSSFPWHPREKQMVLQSKWKSGSNFRAILLAEIDRTPVIKPQLKQGEANKDDLLSKYWFMAGIHQGDKPFVCDVNMARLR